MATVEHFRIFWAVAAGASLIASSCSGSGSSGSGSSESASSATTITSTTITSTTATPTTATPTTATPTTEPATEQTLSAADDVEPYCDASREYMSVVVTIDQSTLPAEADLTLAYLVDLFGEMVTTSPASIRPELELLHTVLTDGSDIVDGTQSLNEIIQILSSRSSEPAIEMANETLEASLLDLCDLIL